jgi:hypothetical protein
MFGGVGVRPAEIYGRDVYGSPQVMAAFITKNAVWLIRMTTGWTCKFQFVPALFAELGPFSIIKLTFWAFHF